MQVGSHPLHEPQEPAHLVGSAPAPATGGPAAQPEVFRHETTFGHEEAMTVHTAIGVVAKEVGKNFEVTEIKGRFKDESGNVRAGLHKDGNDHYFTFDVTFEATIKTETGQEKKAIFTQTIYTSIKAPTGHNIQEFESAKTEAYQLAKSFELLQRNLKVPANPADRTPQQLKALKNDTVIRFQKLDTERGTSDHRIVPLQARSVQSDVELPRLNLTATKVDKKGSGLLLSRLAIMERKEITCEMNREVPLSRYEHYISSRDLPSSESRQEIDKEEYPAFLHAKFAEHEIRFGQHFKAADNQLREINGKLNSEEMQGLKEEYQNVVAKIEDKSTSTADRKQWQKRESELLSEMGIDKLLDSLKQMKKQVDKEFNVQNQLIEIDEGNKASLMEKADVQKEKIGLIQSRIDEIEEQLLKPAVIDEDSDEFHSMIEEDEEPTIQSERRTAAPVVEVEFEPVDTPPTDTPPKPNEPSLLDNAWNKLKALFEGSKETKEPVPEFFDKLKLDQLNANEFSKFNKAEQSALLNYVKNNLSPEEASAFMKRIIE